MLCGRLSLFLVHVYATCVLLFTVPYQWPTFSARVPDVAPRPSRGECDTSLPARLWYTAGTSFAHAILLLNARSVAYVIDVISNLIIRKHVICDFLKPSQCALRAATAHTVDATQLMSSGTQVRDDYAVQKQMVHVGALRR